MSNPLLSKLPSLTRGQALFWLTLALWHLAYLSTFQALFTEWINSHVYSYGPLIWGYSLYLLWKLREHYVHFGKHSNILGFLALASLGFCWLAATITGIRVVQQIAFLGLLYSAILALGGWKLIARLFFPLSLILLTSEVWNVLQIPLRDLSTYIPVEFVRLLGIPILREGYLLTLPGGRFMVEPECSGLSFFMVSCLLAIIYAYEKELSLKRALSLFFLAIAIALLANHLRILTIVLVGNATNMQSILVHEHLIFGWIVYLLAMVPFFGLAYLLLQNKNNSEETPITEEKNTQQNFGFTAGIVSTVLILAPALTLFILSTSDKHTKSTLLSSTMASNKLQQKSTPFYNWHPEFIGADDIRYFSYEHEGRDIQLFMAAYSFQEQGKELVYALNRLYDNRKWQALQQISLTLNVPNGEINGKAITLRSNFDEQYLLYYWYQHGERTASTGISAKLDLLINTLSGKGSNASVQALLIPQKKSEDGSLPKRVEAIIESLMAGR